MVRFVQLLLVVLVLGAFSISLVLAQETTEAAPTAPPSKTATFTPITAATVHATASVEETAEAVVSQPRIEPLTQSDLAILTGNVQRPNGLVFFNEKLYTACNGDFTVYEIDATTASTRTYIWGVRN